MLLSTADAAAGVADDADAVVDDAAGGGCAGWVLGGVRSSITYGADSRLIILKTNNRVLCSQTVPYHEKWRLFLLSNALLL